jgi:hypothetical protein
LPCQTTICQAHIPEYLQTYNVELKCKFCSCEHKTPSQGFKPNVDLQKELEKFLYLSKDHKLAMEKALKLGETQNELNSIAHEPFKYLKNYFLNVKSKIEIEREQLILKIQLISNEMLDDVERAETECLKNLDDFIQIKSLYKKNDLEDLNLIKSELRDPDIDLSKVNQLREDLENMMKEAKSRLKKLKKELLILTNNNNSFDPAKMNLKDELLGRFDFKIMYSNDKSIMSDYVIELNGHAGKVRCIELDEENNRLISGSDDKCIKLWSLLTFQCEKTLRGHLNKVTCLKLIANGSMLISGSVDRTIKIWNLEKNECLMNLTGHKGTIWSLIQTKKYIISASDDSSIKVWDLNVGR